MVRARLPRAVWGIFFVLLLEGVGLALARQATFHWIELSPSGDRDRLLSQASDGWLAAKLFFVLPLCGFADGLGRRHVMLFVLAAQLGCTITLLFLLQSPPAGGATNVALSVGYLASGLGSIVFVGLIMVADILRRLRVVMALGLIFFSILASNGISFIISSVFTLLYGIHYSIIGNLFICSLLLIGAIVRVFKYIDKNIDTKNSVHFSIDSVILWPLLLNQIPY